MASDTVVACFDEAAQRDESTVKLESFKKQVYDNAKMISNQYGGPGHYLEEMLAYPALVNDFAWHLWTYFPEMDDTAYHHAKRLEPTTEKDWATTNPHCLHLSSLGFSRCCSLKPLPGNDVFLLLVEQYLADGFCTNSEPLLVVQSCSPGNSEWKTFCGGPDPLPSFSLGYVLGMARVTSLLALLHSCWKAGLQITDHPVLYDSLLRVYAHHIEHSNKVDEAMHNMRMSARGSIRKSVNVIQAAVMIQTLVQHGLTDFGSFIRKWNQSAARSFKIEGKRAMSLKYLFEQTPKDTCFILCCHYDTFVGCHFCGIQESI